MGLPQKLTGAVPHGAIMRGPFGVAKCEPEFPCARGTRAGGPCKEGGGYMLMCMHQQWYSVCVL